MRVAEGGVMGVENSLRGGWEGRVKTVGRVVNGGGFKLLLSIFWLAQQPLARLKGYFEN